MVFNLFLSLQWIFLRSNFVYLLGILILWRMSFTQVIIAFWPYTGQLIIWCHYWSGNEDLQSNCHLSPIHPESNTWQSEKYMAFYSCGFSILTRFYAEGSWSPQFIPSDVTNPANTPWWLSEDVRLNIALNVNENPLTPQVGNFNWINLARSFIKYYVQVSIPYNCAWTGIKSKHYLYSM